MVTNRAVIAFTLYIGLTLLFMQLMKEAITSHMTMEGAPMAALMIFAVIILAALAFLPIYWKFVITADFFEMPPIKFTREYLKWMATKLRGEERLARLPASRIEIPAPYGDEHLRDPELEILIRSKQLEDADERIQEQMEFYRLKGGADAEMRFNAYTQYMHFMINFRQKLEKE